MDQDWKTVSNSKKSRGTSTGTRGGQTFSARGGSSTHSGGRGGSSAHSGGRGGSSAHSGGRGGSSAHSGRGGSSAHSGTRGGRMSSTSSDRSAGRGRGGYKPSHPAEKSSNDPFNSFKDMIVRQGNQIKYQIKTSGGKLTFDWFKALDTEYKKMYAILYLIKFIPRKELNQYIEILEQAVEEGLWPAHVKETLTTGFTPFQAVNWLPPREKAVSEFGISITEYDAIVTRLYQVCHKAGCDPFIKNKFEGGEDSLLSLTLHADAEYMRKLAEKEHTEHMPLSLEEFKLRLMALCDMPADVVAKNTRATFNKVGSDKEFLRERLQYLLAVDHQTVIDVMANLLVTRKTTNSCNQVDRQIEDYITLILRAFSGSDSAFKKEHIADRAIKFFFGFNEKPVPGSNELLKMLYDALFVAGFAESENRIFNLEGLSVVIGCFAKNNVLLDQYNQFILDCLTIPGKEQFKTIDIETRARMAIRLGKQSEKITPAIAMVFKKLPEINGFISHTISSVIGSVQTTKPMMVHDVQEKEFDASNLNFFIDLNQANFEDCLEDAVYDLEKNLKLYTAQRHEIINRALVSILENINKTTINLVGKIIEKFVELIEKQDISNELASIKSDGLSDIKIDCPFAQKTYEALEHALI
ncbi:Spt5 nonapeptide repeat protein [Fadolivirus algeromassiliense]|jgi:hypothetical protein|uniref:Spt5 nonapeptide repeat protein n=1 Tax=Fadolivirus FV1/VV64 TaxID=3070911 RepID=A0A7D3V8Y9_9VIRU|nr:Spt5 nonapeptide repeat protein [Fadolivirus algeromassiliense]QKF94257.1 Spt5 nonapeptide repeat protein [Fadolivirus FV1/VV64]